MEVNTIEVTDLRKTTDVTKNLNSLAAFSQGLSLQSQHTLCTYSCNLSRHF